jgi:hypothetical protein
MCSGPSVKAGATAGTHGLPSPTQQSTPPRRTRRARVGEDGEPLDGITNDRIRRSDDVKLENNERVGVPGMEAPGLVTDPTAADRVGSVTGVPFSLGGPATIGRFSLNHTRARGITALKPGFPKIGR